MLTSGEYYFAWLLYLAGVVGLGIVWWRITAIIPQGAIRAILRVFYFALMVPPAMLVDGSQRMAPAVMVALLELTIGSPESLHRVYVPFAATFFLAVCLLIGYFVWKNKAQSKK